MAIYILMLLQTKEIGLFGESSDRQPELYALVKTQLLKMSVNSK